MAIHIAGRVPAPLLALACMCVMPASWPAQQSDPVGAPIEIDWQTSPLDLDLRGMNGERYRFHCPPGKALSSRVIGSGPYTDDSSICSAAVHAGAIRAKSGGYVAIEIRPGGARYAGSERNYIHSAGYDRAWNGSFVVLSSDTEATP